MRILESDFITSAADRGGWPVSESFEVALAGRSNVGKSSLLNYLLGRKKLARVSSKPGCTRLLNFFSVRCSEGNFCLVDLPGYGYARVSKGQRETWGPMVNSYLSGRENLKLMVLLVDVRRGPKEEEVALAAVLRRLEIPLKVVLTKSDKASKTSLGGISARIGAALGLPASSVIPFSIVDGLGKEKLLNVMVRALFGAPPSSPTAEGADVPAG